MNSKLLCLRTNIILWIFSIQVAYVKCCLFIFNFVVNWFLTRNPSSNFKLSLQFLYTKSLYKRLVFGIPISWIKQWNPEHKWIRKPAAYSWTGEGKGRKHVLFLSRNNWQKPDQLDLPSTATTTTAATTALRSKQGGAVRKIMFISIDLKKCLFESPI